MFAERIDFSHEATLTIDELIKRAEVLLPENDLTILRKAYEFAEKMHFGVKRSSGEPYIIHPFNRCASLCRFGWIANWARPDISQNAPAET